ncbi:MAG: putative diguanylate cyclase YegE [Syntrophorhabdaceae bacterium PtaU1.Bin034]|nr:MAG: putative diguanylate cyclase YegE [Syntrophorhabdaceae bacterium PtaU1.Bin034]
MKPSLDRCFSGQEVRDETWINFPVLGRRYCEIQYLPYAVEGGSFDRAVVIISDMTERKEAERQLKAYQEHLEKLVEERTEELRKSEEKYRNIFENAVEGMFQTTPDGGFLNANPALASMYGFDNPQQLIESISDVRTQLYLYPETRNELMAIIERHGLARNFEHQTRAKDGTIKWASLNCQIVRDKSGKILYYEGTIQDITERKQAEQALREAEEKYRNIFLNATEGIFQVTPDGRPLSLNPAFARIHGYDSPEDLMSHITNIKEIHVDLDRRDEFIKLLETQGYVYNFEFRMYRKDGSIIWISVNARVVRDENGKMLHRQGTVQDITERKRLQEQIFLQRDLALELARTSSLDKALPLCLETAIKMSGMECGGVWLKNPTGDLELVSSVGISEDVARKLSRVPEGSGGWTLTMEGKSIFMRPTKELTPTSFAEGYKYIAIIPIILNHEVTGSFNILSKVLEEMPQQDRIALDLLAAELGNIIARLNDQQQLQEEVKRRREAEKALEAERLNLQETNTALKVLLKHREEDKKELEERFVSNVKQLVLPYIEKLKKTRLEDIQRTEVDFLETNLNEIVSPFLNNIRAFNFTPRQIEIIALIKEGRTTKEIADLLHVGKGAIDLQRFLIRKRLGLNKDKTNLRSYLLSLA